ncbi:BamA/TamA family outer membrane protein [Bacteroides fragilis]|uniref:translocation and assembly module lipoprotein TamL n=1 Tax=Bacteroides TaxID=816 RepID=UPI002030BB53|nr:BamA/TamA family outer membrane protein [Bacteroides fragilis]MCE8586084.1 outer membrane protein assembly factor [Bacteroides fragilis]MCE8590146.1 outer membrane protein assembly factor [Bacteroides fragilis]MCE8656722.1 outer membrane protein assembly factor [Bacteroides fragilis]MCE8661953.1 outer membrane protein assembly factor [Bacteroides fragilis]MCM0261753.1 BamA/TamA family outer membrane protein [Bacteroides fragilis]
MKKGVLYTILLYFVLSLASCSATKFVPEGSYLLDEVKIHTDNKDIKPSDMRLYVRQNPNSKWFSAVKTQLYVYNWSGRDSTKWLNKFLRKIGDAPVIYNEADAIRSQEEIAKAVQNLGYMGATVKRTIKTKKKKLKLFYEINSGRPYTVRTLKYDISDKKIAEYLQNDSTKSTLKEGMLFDVNTLDTERQRITDYLLCNGYYKFNKDYITYTADTARNTYQVDLTLHLLPYKAYVGDVPKEHPQYKINKINFITDYDVLQSSALSSIEINDSLHYNGFPIYYKDQLYLRPKVLVDNLRFTSGDLYDERNVQKTYTYFGRLSALKYTNIRFFETQNDDSTRLNCYVMLTKSKHKSISFELEGTNSAGDLGAAASVSFQHRNLFRGSETFMVKFRGAYEAISGLQPGYKNHNYTEYGVETSINFPSFLFPFLTSDFKRRIRATTEFGLQYNYQLRPEFSRTIASASWSYKWMQKQKIQHRIDLLDISYLYLPWISPQFQEDYIDKDKDNYILRYNYENRLIVRMGYTYNYNSAGGTLVNNTITSNSYSIRAGFESAGNILYGVSKMINMRKNKDGEYAILGIPYAQYLKGDFDFAKNIIIDHRNSLAFHAGIGVAVPYGNAKVVPFEKRYFSGGANSVRGWSVRNLGPGSFAGDGNFMNQSGDIKLDASIEYRTRLFWKFRGAAFIDAGNIWTIREYENQPGGAFEFDKFYKQIAVAYGLGLRLDLDFFVLRFDGGMKAVNPKYEKTKERYPIIHPKFSRDFAFHFAVGYPF